MEQLVSTPSNGNDQETVEQKIDRLALSVQQGREDLEALAVSVKDGFDVVDEQLLGLKTDVVKIRATMVTKDYLDERLAILKGDLIVKMRKLDGKSDFIIAILQTRSLMKPEDMQRVREEFQIFPVLPERDNDYRV